MRKTNILLSLAFLSLACLPAQAQPAHAAAAKTAKSAAKPPSVPATPEFTRTQRGNMDTYTDFYSPSLGGTRTIHVLLPEGYNSNQQSYQSLYMLDGQNLFSPKMSSYGKCWHVPEVLSSLYASGKINEVVLIAIDAGADRAKDYTPYKGRGGAGGGADAYATFLSRDLILFMETNYRLLRGPENRAIAGSSLGGIMALYLMAQKPELFSMAIAMSPALGWSPDAAVEMVKNAHFAPDARIWMDTGLLEGDYAGGVMSEPLMFSKLETAMLSGGKLVYGKNLLAYLDPAGIHEESAWGRRLPLPLRWFFGKEDMAVHSVEGVTSASVAGLDKASPGNMLFHGRIKFQGGLEADYIPLAAKSSPPYFAWDGAFSLVSGAEPVPVKFSADYAGRKFSSTVQLVRALPAECEVSFSATVPAGIAQNARVFVTGSLAQFGNWKADGLALTRDADNTRLWRGKVKLPRGAGGAYKFTLGSWATVEKNAAGEDTGDRAILCDRTAAVAAAEVARFGAAN